LSIKSVLAAFVVLAMGPGAFADPLAPLPVRPSIEDFLEDAQFIGPELSPSGQYLSGIRRVEDALIFMTIDLSQTEMKPNMVAMGDYLPVWTEWASDDRLLVKVRGFVDLTGRGGILSLDDMRKGKIKGIPFPFERLMAIDRDGSNAMPLLSDKRDFQRSYFNANVVDFLRDDPEHVLMAAELGNDLDLFKVNIITGDYERIALGTSRTYAWYVDRNGEPAFRFNTNRRRTVVYIYAREDRDNGKIKWRKVRTIRLDQNSEIRDKATEFKPLEAGPTATTYYVAARPDGAQTTGIYLYDFEKDEFLETIKADETYDVENALFNGKTGAYEGVFYYRDRLTLEFLDGKLQANLNGLQVYFGDNTNILPLGASNDGQTWLIKSIGPTDAGTLHIYHLDEARVESVASTFPKLYAKTLADTEIINYTARDGLQLTGYLTRPSGLRETANPPLIVMPHGGPEERDMLNFDFTVQILAAHGYQVFQPNFRGSSGYGLDFVERGYGQWGRAMQTDIEDGFAHLVADGKADADRACIMGASYGGYAAMAGVALTPDLYRCGISFAGVSDLNQMLRWERKEEGSDSEAYEYWVKQIGDPKRDEDAIREVSPATFASRVTAPLLLLHGEDDGIVDIEQSEIMDEAMRDAGKSVRFVRFEDTGHSYFGDDQEDRYYREVLAFLRLHLPSELNAPVPTQSAAAPASASSP